MCLRREYVRDPVTPPFVCSFIHLFVRCIGAAEYLPDVVPWVKFCDLVWTHDNSGFFFARYPVPRAMLDNPTMKAGTETDSNENQQVGMPFWACCFCRCRLGVRLFCVLSRFYSVPGVGALAGSFSTTSSATPRTTT